MLEKIQETAAFLKEKMHTNPETAIILGTGLGSLEPTLKPPLPLPATQQPDTLKSMYI